MKKIILLISIAIYSNIASAQIQLKDDSVIIKNETSIQRTLNAQNFEKLKDLTTYNAKIQGFIGFCNYEKEDQKQFYDFYVNNLMKLNLTKDEMDILSRIYQENSFKTKRDGFSGMDCKKFKDDFEKIMTDIKKSK